MLWPRVPNFPDEHCRCSVSESRRRSLQDKREETIVHSLIHEALMLDNIKCIINNRLSGERGLETLQFYA